MFNFLHYIITSIFQAGVNQAAGGSGSIQYVVSGQSFPMTTLIPAQTQAQPTKQTHSAPVTYSVQPVAGGSITTIFTPAGL